MQYKKSQIKNTKSSRVKCPTPLDSESRTPLINMPLLDTEMESTAISLTNFGAYVDIGTEYDGLIHIGQMRRDLFVENPRQILAPGDNVTVRVLRCSPSLNKLHLTMLLTDLPINTNDVSNMDRIPLNKIEADYELWGKIVRTTSYGAYAELRAEVEGFLHFMDHPEFGEVPGAPHSGYMALGDRVRLWVSEVDMDKGRVKLTENRPMGIPGPRREIRMGNGF